MTNYKKTYELIDNITQSIKRMENGSTKEDDYLREKITDLWSELKLHLNKIPVKTISELKEMDLPSVFVPPKERKM